MGPQNGYQALYISSHQPTRGRFWFVNIFNQGKELWQRQTKPIKDRCLLRSMYALETTWKQLRRLDTKTREDLKGMKWIDSESESNNDLFNKIIKRGK